MNVILTLVRKDLANFLRNRTAVVLTFFVPIALIYVFGYVWGLNRKTSGGGPQGIRLAVVNSSVHPAAQRLVDSLKKDKSFRVIDSFENPDGTKRPLAEADARALIHDNTLRFALVLPPDLVSGEDFGLNLKILSNPQNTIEAQMVEGLLQKTIFSNVPQLLGQALQARSKDFLGAQRHDEFNHAMANAITGAFGGDADEVLQQIESGDFGFSQLTSATQPATGNGSGAANNDVFSQLVKIDRQQLVGRDVKSPDATRVIGGQAIMFLLFALSGGAAAFFDEKNAGLFQRLLSSPVTRGQLLWSRFLWGTLLGLVQLTVLFLAGQVLYGIDVTGHLGKLVLVCIAAAAACTSFGMLIAAITPNAQAASGVATLLVMIMAATGGAWFPSTFLPDFMQQFGKLTIVYWSMDGFARVLWAGNSLLELLPTLGILFGIATAVMLVAVWRLNQKKIFG